MADSPIEQFRLPSIDSVVDAAQRQIVNFSYVRVHEICIQIFLRLDNAFGGTMVGGSNRSEHIPVIDSVNALAASGDLLEPDDWMKNPGLVEALPETVFQKPQDKTQIALLLVLRQLERVYPGGLMVNPMTIDDLQARIAEISRKQAVDPVALARIVTRAIMYVATRTALVELGIIPKEIIVDTSRCTADMDEPEAAVERVRLGLALRMLAVYSESLGIRLGLESFDVSNMNEALMGQVAIELLAKNGVFVQAQRETAEPVGTIKNATPKPGRNDPCHCGSEKKYKKCHEKSDQDEERKRNEQLKSRNKSNGGLPPGFFDWPGYGQMSSGDYLNN